LGYRQACVPALPQRCGLAVAPGEASPEGWDVRQSLEKQTEVLGR